MKKAQVTAFIIIGLIVLLSIVLFFFFKSTYLIRDPDQLIEKLSPIEKFVTQCLANTATEAVQIISQQGGYINIPLNVQINPSRYVNPDTLGIIKIPLWFYGGNRFSPDPFTVAREISLYVEDNADSCIKEFKSFEEIYDIQILDDMKVTTFLNKEDITIIADFPLKIFLKSNNTVTQVDRFRTGINVPLRRALEISNKILDAEIDNGFLENFTLNLMTSNPAIPFTDMKFSCQIDQWTITNVKNELDEMLKVNLPRIRVKGTDYHPFNRPEKEYEKLLEYHMEDIAEGNFPEDVPGDAFEYLHMFWDAGFEEDVVIGFKHIPKIIDLVARPNDNGIMRSQLVEGDKEFTSFLCINVHHFIYDVNFPVITTIRLDDFIFNFAMPVTIHNNEPFKKPYNFDFFTVSYYDRGFCEDRSFEETDIRAVGSKDGFINVELNEVNITYQCFKYFCSLGETNADQGIYRLRAQLPASCTNPFIIAQKPGYLKAKKQLTDPDRLTLELEKLKSLPYSVLVHRYNSFGKVIEAGVPLDSDMNVSIRLELDQLFQYKIFPVDVSLSENIRNINLVEGTKTYKLNLVLVQGDEYVGGFNGDWSPGEIEVLSATEIEFHVIKYVPIPYTKEDKLKMTDFILNGEYQNSLRPVLK